MVGCAAGTLLWLRLSEVVVFGLVDHYKALSGEQRKIPPLQRKVPATFAGSRSFVTHANSFVKVGVDNARRIRNAVDDLT